jgi:hypothetical protein
VIALAWSVGLYMMLPSAGDRLTDEVVSSHVRSLCPTISSMWRHRSTHGEAMVQRQARFRAAGA